MAVSHMSAFLASIFFATVGWLPVNEDPGGREDDAMVEEAWRVKQGWVSPLPQISKF